MLSDSSSTEKQKEKQSLINSLWDSLFGGDCQKPQDEKSNLNPNRRLYMVGLEDFSGKPNDKKLENAIKKSKINEENVKRKQNIENSKTVPDLGKTPEKPPKSKKIRPELKDEKIKENEKNVNLVLPDASSPVNDKGREKLKREKTFVKDVEKKHTNKISGEELDTNSKVSFSFNHLPEDAKERSEIIAHVLERVDSLKKKMQNEKQMSDNTGKEQKQRSASVGKTVVSPTGSVKTIYWPKDENNNTHKATVVSSETMKTLNRYCDPKRQRLEHFSKIPNKKPENIGDIDNNPKIKNIEAIEKLDLKCSLKQKRYEQKNIDETVSKKNEVRPNRKLDIMKQLDLRQKSIFKFKYNSVSDTSICSSRVKNNRFNEFATNQPMDEKKFGAVNVAKSDKILKDAKELMSKRDDIQKGYWRKDIHPSKKGDVKETDFGVFNIEIENEETNTLFIIDSELEYDDAGMTNRQPPNHVLASDGSGEKGIMESPREVKKSRNYFYNKVMHNVSELEQNKNSCKAKNDSEKRKTRLIQTFMESQKTAMKTTTMKKNYDFNFSNGFDCNLSAGEKGLISQTSKHLFPHNESTITNSVGDIFKIRNYIPASQRRTEFQTKFSTRLVNLSFNSQVASCFKIVVQYGKALSWKTFSNQENSELKNRMVQFAHYPRCDTFHPVLSDVESSGTSENILEVHGDDGDLQTEDDLGSALLSDLTEETEEISGEIKSTDVENYSGEEQLYNFENNGIRPSVSSISNPVYVVIMEANEKDSSSFGKAEICKIENARFSEMLRNEISGANKKLVVESERLELAKNDESAQTEPVSCENPKKSFFTQSRPSQSFRDKVKSRASSVCLPSGVNKSHTKRNANPPKVRFCHSNVLINRAKPINQVSDGRNRSRMNNQVGDVRNELPLKMRNKGMVEPPEYLNTQLMSIREEIRELRNMFANN